MELFGCGSAYPEYADKRPTRINEDNCHCRWDMVCHGGDGFCEEACRYQFWISFSPARLAVVLGDTIQFASGSYFYTIQVRLTIQPGNASVETRRLSYLK